ncbi:MAG: GTPase HflX [Clostridia bacterium]|nr:GTPase HflX [Clostridia bacterium]
MFDNGETPERAILVGVCRNLLNPLLDTTDESMRELSCLAETAGAEVLGEMVQNREAPDKATFIGEGKLEELCEMCKNLGANLVIFDDELTGSQLKNIEKALGEDIRVIDRSALILDIFANRALSSAGKLQVELAQLKYALPQLSGGYTSLSRTGGGIGTRGPGETKIETDRRYIRTRIGALTRELEALTKHRELIRSGRKKREVPTAALVGYTNAGKSTLLNALTGASVLAEDKLFATLDPTSRAIVLPDGREAVLTDTVGFIRKLPHKLIEAFKSTLEEASEADVIVHVIDSSSPEMDNQIEVVKTLLEELHCSDKPTVSVFNKCDLAEDKPRPPKLDNCVYISAKKEDGLEKLIDALDNTLPGKRRKLKVLIPFTDGRAVNDIQLLGSIISIDYTENGTLIEFMADPKAISLYGKYIYE